MFSQSARFALVLLSLITCVALVSACANGDRAAADAARDYVRALASGDDAEVSRLSWAGSETIVEGEGSESTDDPEALRRRAFESGEVLNVRQVTVVPVEEDEGNSELGQLGSGDMGDESLFLATIELKDGTTRKVRVSVWTPPGERPSVGGAISWE